MNQPRLTTRCVCVFAVAILTLGLVPQSFADEWMTWASTYTHDPVEGQRIDQHSLPVQPVVPYQADFQRSGYRNYRSTLQAGQSSDNIHVVEQWGKQVVPYEQWRFPYRPYAVPYDAWGPQAPYGLFNGSVGYGPGYPTPYGPTPHGPPAGTPGSYPPGAGYPGAPGNGPGRGYPPGYGHPGYGYPGQGAGAPGFPLTPEYRGQPWFDGNYPSAPPLDRTPDERFYYKPSRG